MPGNVCAGKTSLISRNEPVRENITREISSSKPPWGRSAEYFLAPLTIHVIVPPLSKNRLHMVDIVCGTCPTTALLLLNTATAYGSWMFPGSCLQDSTSVRSGVHVPH